MTEKVENFLVNTTIIEGRHLTWPNMDSAVHIRIDNQRKCTGIRYTSDCPAFNEYFVFEFLTTLEALIDKTITLTVIQPRKVWRSKKTLGFVSLDMATVWAQPDHQFYHKWAILDPPINDATPGPRGYLKIDISIIRKGEVFRIPSIDHQDTDEIEGNLLLPEGSVTERQRTNYIFSIYRGESICKSKYIDVKFPVKDPPSPCIEICFAGLKGKTFTKRNTADPVWNESLVLSNLFPPLCQRIKINLYNVEPCQCTIVATRYINLRSISNDKEHGFLPTFGPTFVHFYAKGNSTENFVGKVLMAFKTELQFAPTTITKSVMLQQIPPLPEVNLWKSQTGLLFAIIFNANLINKKYCDKPLTFEINFGKNELQKNKLVTNRTDAIAPMAKGKHYWYLEYGQDKPCLFSMSKVIDFQRRMFNANIISKIIEELTSKLDTIEVLFLKEQYAPSSLKLENLLVEVTDTLSSACKKYLDITQSDTGDFQTELDKARREFYRREMEDIISIAKNVYNPKMKKKSFKEMQKLLRRLELLAEEEQDCWANVYVTMISGSKKVAYYKFPAKDLVYSVVDEKKGKYCSKFQSIFLQANTSKKTAATVACKLDIMLWLGLERYRKECSDMFPSGFILPNDLALDHLPTYLVAQNKYYFQCRVHVYQGKFLPGSDKSGLCDPFVRVIFGTECKQTVVSQATLHPVWDQSLIYTNLVLYGAKPFIQNNPPTIVMEVFDKDECCRNEFVGRCILKPALKFIEVPYKPPNFPPKLHWHKIYKGEEMLGEILTVAELLELSDKSDDANVKPTNEIVRIPSDVKPSMVKYRIDMIFWGVRELKNINFFPITKPKITLECAYAILQSDVIVSTKKSRNFTQLQKHMDISLPEQEEYAPPICIKMFDCRSFGRYTLAGTHIVSVEDFLYTPLTSTDRKQRLFSEESLRFRSPIPLSSGSRHKAQPKRRSSHSLSRRPRFASSSTIYVYFPVELIKNLFVFIFQACPGQKTVKKINSVKNSSKLSKIRKCFNKFLNFLKKPFVRKKMKKEVSKIDRPSKTSVKTKTKASSSNEENSAKALAQSDSVTKNTASEVPKRLAKKKKCICCLCLKACFRSLFRCIAKLCCIFRRRKGTPTNETRTHPKENERSCWRKCLRVLCCFFCICKSCFKREKKNKTIKSKNIKRSSSKIVKKEESFFKRLCGRKIKREKSVVKHDKEEQDLRTKSAPFPQPEDYDWWTKYRDSVEGINEQTSDADPQDILKRRNSTLKVYPNELELQPEFEGFTDILQSFQMYKGKRTGDETVDEENITGIFKGAIKIYRWPPPNQCDYVTPTGLPFKNGAFQEFISNEPLNFLIRIYCVKGINLRPKDLNGLSDPYICIKMGNQSIKDSDNYVPKQINPVFGRCFELRGTFSKDHTITVAVWDWDLATPDDLIGETKIDIENRFYSRHRGNCGIASTYELKGYCQWRDNERPTQILEYICRRNHIDPPKYGDSSVRILNREFAPTQGERSNIDKETLALCALRHWQEIPLLGCDLVPEHIETRSLYHPAKPGIEQGKLQLWIDIFPCSSDLPPPKQVDITPRKPVAYELRVIIWNTEDVILADDNFFVGEKMSDIYIKGWVADPREFQCTDVHYHSTSGEGSFNWRFIFRFNYIATENKMVIKEKDTLFSIDEIEHKQPCKLSLQVWDNDTFTADDFLGTISLDLARLPRGARSPNNCTLENILLTAPALNLFRTRRTKGWWPFRGVNPKTFEEIVAGKVEMEFELITVEEAEKIPAGLGRAEPQPLPSPTRPDTSFSWLRNPLKTVKFVLCKQYRWRLFKCIVCAFAVMGLLLGIYAFPGYTVKKLLGV